MYKVKKKLVCLDATTATTSTTNKLKTKIVKKTQWGLLRKNQENSSDPIFLFEECECVHEDEKQILFSFFFPKKNYLLMNHSVEISWLFYHSDFMWNQFWGF